jgi:ATP-binding cassette subfamily G (WHITE) protein 2 (SNQ2)
MALAQLLDLAKPTTWLSRKPPSSRVLLHKITGTVGDGEMVMVVGRPGSGCTTFLKSIANMREEYLGMEGDVWYGTFDAATANKLAQGKVAFVGKQSSLECL